MAHLSRSFILLSLIFSVARSQNPGQAKRDLSGKGLRMTDAHGVSWAKHALQGFNMKLWMSNQIALGIQAWDPYPVPPGNCGFPGIGLEYPAGSCIEHLYGAGPWIGAIVNGVRRVTEGYNGDDARKEFLPERQDTARDRFWETSIHNIGEPNRRGFDDDGDGRIDEDELDGLDNDGDWNPAVDDIGADGLPDSLEVSCDGKVYNPITNPDPAYDNYDRFAFDKCHTDANGNYLRKSDKNLYTQNNGIPDHGEPHVDEDYGAVSDKDFGVAATDTFKSYLGLPDHVPMGAKIWQKSYAWQSGTSADAIVFMNYSFVDIGPRTWQDAYVAMFADMDVGPVSVSGYYSHNYAAYDPATHTAYVDNPIDRGSTPLGLTFLGTTRPLDSLKFIFQWHGFNEPGTLDSVIYSWMDGEAFPNQLIKPNQSPDAPTDTRVFVSFGPFQANPGDSLKAAFAFVSGSSISEMLNNAARAHRIYESRGFIMPITRISNPGGGGPITISWDRIDRSSFGPVTSYQVLYGTSSGQYTNSVTTSGLSATISGLTAAQSYFFAVSAIDDKGNHSALSDELSNSPAFPRGVTANGGQTSITIRWNANTDLALAGYNIYRHTSRDTSEQKLNSGLLLTPVFTDSMVRGDLVYYYKVSAVDVDGHVSRFSDEVKGSLLPPAVPVNFIVGPGKSFLHLNWKPNTEGDLAGYNIYRSRNADSNFAKLNNGFWRKADFIDSTVQQDTQYYYRIEAVDTTAAVSGFTPTVLIHTVKMDQGILVVNATYDVNSFPSDTARMFFASLLQGYRYTIPLPPQSPPTADPLYFGNYSTVLWFYEEPYYFLPAYMRQYPSGLKAYLLGGGRLLLSGRKINVDLFSYWYPFLKDVFGIDLLLQISPAATFYGAMGSSGFPNLGVDAAKLAGSNGRLNNIERFPTASPGRVLYAYRSDPFDSIADGEPVGLRSLDTAFHTYYLSFPLYYLDQVSAKALLTKVLSDFDEVTGIKDDHQALPRSFRLYDAYPNPFNPGTTIRFDLPTPGDVTLAVYDVLGKEVARLIDGRKSAGVYQVPWNASLASSGVYFCRIVVTDSRTPGSGAIIDTKKLILLK
ncbi:MAG TPA: fibronectin type III domain-containing protein [Bacteroidota bacterium]|nr:fibronectin type III domain-containing protein [Bacteroidota bacterium]